MENTYSPVSCPLLSHNTEIFSKDNFSKLEDIMYKHNISAGSYLFWDGDKAEKLYYVQQGQVKITKSTDDGREFVLYLFQEGDLFGEIGSFGESSYSFNAEVPSDSHIGVIYQRDLEILLWQHGDLAVEFMKWMGLMHRITQSKFRDLMLFGKPGALCSTLIRLSNTYGKEYEGHLLISKKLTNSELGELIGATRESVNRMLKDLKDRNVIAMNEGYIIIQDFAYLKEICHCENCPIAICRV
jgi:CRP/FNR family cyclic AMP-dependent transcriptional regulator